MAADAIDYTRAGPYAVGTIETELDSPSDPIDAARRLPVTLWYPAFREGRDDETAANTANTANAAANAAPAPHPLGLPHAAEVGLPPADDQAFPLIAFSHGNSGFGLQSTFLMTHLASWGFVLAAPDHVGNTFGEMLGVTDPEILRDIHLRARRQRPVDLVTVVQALLSGEVLTRSLPPLCETAGALGHSFGGWTALKTAALEPRIRTICALAPVSEAFVGRRAFADGELPLRETVTALVVGAQDDVLVDLESSIRPLCDRLGPKAELAVVPDADHFHFCDGIEMLHKMHENNPREFQTRKTRPYVELQNEPQMHAWLRDRVARHFSLHLARRPTPP